MKKITLVLFFILVCFAVKAQTIINITDNPAQLDPSTTDSVRYVFPHGTFPDNYSRAIFLYAPSSNASTVKFNFQRNTLVSSPAIAGNDQKLFYFEVKNGEGFLFKASGTDKIIVFW